MADEQGRKARSEDEVVEGEVLAEYSDQTLLNLPTIEDEEEAPAASEAPVTLPVDEGRRAFVLQLLLGGGAALALGGAGAFWLAASKRQPTTVVLPNGVELPPDVNPGDLAEMAGLVARLQGELQSVEAERDQLLLDLDDSQRALAEAQALNELWRQHDEIGLDDLIVAALGVLTGLIGGLVTNGATLLTGLSSADETIAAFTARLPGPRDGLRWLAGQVTALATALSNLKETIKAVVTPADAVTSMVTDFIRWILERLPFGAGNSASAGLDAMEALVNSIPAHVDGLNTSVLAPLADWFSDAADKNLTGILITPIVNAALGPARSFAETFADFNEQYQAQLATPVNEALSQRAALKQEISSMQAEQAARRLA